MGSADSLLTPEAIGTGITGLVIAGLVVRNAVKGWIEAKAQAANISSNTTAMMGAVSIGFERDQRELMLQTLIRIANALEAQAFAQEGISKAQTRLAEIEQRELNDHIQELLDKLRDVPDPPRRR